MKIIKYVFKKLFIYVKVNHRKAWSKIERIRSVRRDEIILIILILYVDIIYYTIHRNFIFSLPLACTIRSCSFCDLRLSNYDTFFINVIKFQQRMMEISHRCSVSHEASSICNMFISIQVCISHTAENANQ